MFYLCTGARAFAPPREPLTARAGQEGGTVEVEGWIAELPTERIWENGGTAMETEMEVTSLFGETGWERTSGRVLLRVDAAPEKMPKVGDVVRLAGYLTLPERPKNPGEFDRVQHLQSRGLDYLLKVRTADVESSGADQGCPLSPSDAAQQQTGRNTEGRQS